jgi:hypothetical protein
LAKRFYLHLFPHGSHRRWRGIGHVAQRFALTTSSFKVKIKVRIAGWGEILKRVASCALVTKETAEPGEGDILYAIWPALPI